MTHIFEHCGILLHVDYTDGDPPTFNAIHVMDECYRPIGPDISPLLHQALLIREEPVQGAQVEAETFLSAICEDLP